VKAEDRGRSKREPPPSGRDRGVRLTEGRTGAGVKGRTLKQSRPGAVWVLELREF
jgi:hypothetical protein